MVAAQRGDLTGKPRPYVVVQREVTLAESVTVTVCPITSQVVGGAQIRIPLEPGTATGLAVLSEVEVDRVTTLRKERVRQVVGVVPADRMAVIDRALRRWLDL